MSFSNFLETEILDHVFANNAYTAPTTLYLALFTANPDEDGSGAEVSTSGTAYARQTVWASSRIPHNRIQDDTCAPNATSIPK